MMNDRKKYVVSTTLTSADLWRNSRIISDDVIEEVKRLKAEDGKSIYLDGSSVLVHALLEADLVDSLHLLVYPIVLGGGKRLFPEGMRHNFGLLEQRAFPSGVVLLLYVRA